MENAETADSQQVAEETDTLEKAETIDCGGDFEDPTAPEKPSESRTFSETENPSISNENAETVDSQQDADDGLSQETVENLLHRLETGESHRVIAEETGVSRTDLTAISKYYRLWQKWNLAGNVDSQQSAAKILELEAEKDRISKEKVALKRELKLLTESTAGERKWLERFKPQLDAKILKLTEELSVTHQKNRELTEAVERAETGGPWITHAQDYQDGYQKGREYGREEMRLEGEAQGTSWLTWLLVPLTGVAGIIAGALLVWVLK
jgi:hypothetical protein